MIRKISFALISLILFIPIVMPSHTFAQEEVSIVAESAIILFMQGSVKIKSQKAATWEDAQIEMILSKGDSLKTGKRSWAEVGFGEDFVNVVRIKENTVVDFIDLGPIRLGLLKGEIRSLVESLSKDTTFEIKIPTAICGARGTGWDTNTDGKKVIVDAYDKDVFIKPISEKVPQKETIIKAGKRGILEDPIGPITIKDLPIERMRDWNRWKKDFEKRIVIEPPVKEVKKDVAPTREDLKVKHGKLEKVVRDIDKCTLIQKADRAENIERIKKIDRIMERRMSGGMIGIRPVPIPSPIHTPPDDRRSKVTTDKDKDRIETAGSDIEGDSRLADVDRDLKKRGRLEKLGKSLEKRSKLKRASKSMDRRNRLGTASRSIESRTGTGKKVGFQGNRDYIGNE